MIKKPIAGQFLFLEFLKKACYLKSREKLLIFKKIMAFQEFIRKDYLKGTVGKPLITLRSSTVAFNSEFTRMDKLSEYTHIKFFPDEKNFRIGFKFHNDPNDENAMKLWTDSKYKSSRNASIEAFKKRYK